MEIDIQEINTRIQTIKAAAEELKALSDNFPAVARNITRLLASTKMLEIEVSDIVAMDGE